jgi:hypothetical protein
MVTPLGRANKERPEFRVSCLECRVDLIQVISTLASSRGVSIITLGVQIGFNPTEIAVSCFVFTRLVISYITLGPDPKTCFSKFPNKLLTYYHIRANVLKYA